MELRESQASDCFEPADSVEPAARVANFGPVANSVEWASVDQHRSDACLDSHALVHVAQAWVGFEPEAQALLASSASFAMPDWQALRDSAAESAAVCLDGYCRAAVVMNSVQERIDFLARLSQDGLHCDAPVSHLHPPGEFALPVAAKRDGRHSTSDCPAAGRAANAHSTDDPHPGSQSDECSRESRNGLDPPGFRD